MLYGIGLLGSLDQLGGVLSDHQLLVGGNDPDLDLGVGGGDEHLLAALAVQLGVDLDTHEGIMDAHGLHLLNQMLPRIFCLSVEG